MNSHCKNDTDGDGNCHLCAKRGGCPVTNPLTLAQFLRQLTYADVYAAWHRGNLQFGIPSDGNTARSPSDNWVRGTLAQLQILAHHEEKSISPTTKHHDPKPTTAR